MVLLFLLNQFHATGHFLYPLKTLGVLIFFFLLWEGGLERDQVVCTGLKKD